MVFFGSYVGNNEDNYNYVVTNTAVCFNDTFICL